MAGNAWNDKLLGILGGGNMAEALVRGVLSAGLMPANAVIVYDPDPERLAVFSALDCGVAVFPTEAVNVDVVLIATKPQVLFEALKSVEIGIRKETLLISIAAGVTTAAMEKVLPRESRVIRVMPNTPLLVGAGVSALARGSRATASDMGLALGLFACAGVAMEVAEKDLDAVTALSGSGPAYLFRFAEALIAGGVGMGLPPELARDLTIGTLRGSAEMLAQIREPAPLRERVTSPGGTTAAALGVLDGADFCGLVAKALVAARDRSRELGRG